MAQSGQRIGAGNKYSQLTVTRLSSLPVKDEKNSIEYRVSNQERKKKKRKIKDNIELRKRRKDGKITFTLILKNDKL